MASKLSSRDRELLSTQQQRRIGLRPYENGYFGEQAADFILFELFDASGNLITHKNLSSLNASHNTPTSLALHPAEDIKGLGYNSGIFKVKYQFLRKLAGDDTSVLIQTEPVQVEGKIYPTTKDFHITDDGLIFESTEQDWQQSAAASVPLKIEDYKYQIDRISPSRTEVGLKAKNIKGAYQEEFYRLQEGRRYINIGLPPNSDPSSDAVINFVPPIGGGSATDPKTALRIQVISDSFMVATNGGFSNRMVGGTLTIPNVYKVGETFTKVRSQINLVHNSSGEELNYNEDTGDPLVGSQVSEFWDTTLHNNAVHPLGWSSGYYDGFGDHVGTEAVGFHAHWVRGEGVQGGTCMKFPDTNFSFIEDPEWDGDEHRHLKISTDGLTNLLSQGAVVDDSVNISFDMKSTAIGKGVTVYLRYAQSGIEEEEPTGRLILDVSELGNLQTEEKPADPPVGYKANTYSNANTVEIASDVEVDPWSNTTYNKGLWTNVTSTFGTPNNPTTGEHVFYNPSNPSWDVPSHPSGAKTSTNGCWKWYSSIQRYDNNNNEWFSTVVLHPDLHNENVHGTLYTKNGELSPAGQWEWNAAIEDWESISIGTLLEPVIPTTEQPTAPPTGYEPATIEGAEGIEEVPIGNVVALEASGVNPAAIVEGATSEIVGGVGVWIITAIATDGGAGGAITWTANLELLSTVEYSKKGALDSSAEWMWNGVGLWGPVYLSPAYADYVDAIEQLVANGYMGSPELVIPVIDTSTGQSIQSNYYNGSNWNNPATTEWNSPLGSYWWDGTEWDDIYGGDFDQNYEYVLGGEGSQQAVPSTKNSEWERMEANITIPPRFRRDLPWNIVFYGHNVGAVQGITWVDNVYADITYEQQTITSDILKPYSTIITGRVDNTTIDVADSYNDVKARFETGGIAQPSLYDFSFAKISYLVNNPFDLRTYLKHNNQLFLTTNFKRDAAAVSEYPHSLMFKLYKPLPRSFRKFDEFTIVKEMMDPVEDTVKIVDFIDTDVGDVVLKTPDMNNITYVQRHPTEYKTETDILTSDATISEKLRNEFISQSFESIEINTDYGQFKNFINFSSVEKRIRNFQYKLELIESYTDTSGSFVGISSSLDDRKFWRTKINELKNNFDDFESYMYFKSSSRSSGSLGIFYSNAWPKTGGSGSVRYPYTLAHTTSSQGLSWFSNQITSASNYDNDNLSRLSYHLPSFIEEDDTNTEYVNFTDMVAQHFDSIWIYANAITDTFDRRDKLDEGISKELLYTMARSLGWEIPNAKDLVSLPRYAYGVEVTGSIYSNYSAVSERDISREIWSRIINNMPFFLKNKGTVRALKGLINVYGIPSTILRVKEYGGPDLPNSTSPSYEITRKFTKALDFRSSQYVRTTWTNDGYTSRKPDAVEFRFRAATGSNQILIEKQSTSTDQDWIIRLKDNSSSDNYGYVSFMLSSSAVGTSVGQYKELTSSAMPVYDGDFYSVMLQRSSGSDNPSISQSYELHVGKYDASRSRINLYSKSTMNVNVAASSSFNLAWTGSGDVYIGGRATIANAGIRFSGSIMEYRHWTEALQTSSFKNHIANPKAYDGNSVSSSYRHLTLRYSFDDNQDLSTYAGGVLDSRAEQQKAYSGSYVGFTGNFFRNVVDELKTHIPSIGALRRTTKKIRIENDDRTGGNLNANHRVTLGSYDTAPLDSNKVGIFFAPTDVINTDIINSVANLNFDNYLGDPRDLTEYSYRGLDYVANNYWKKYNSPNDFWDYIRILKYYDQSMFPQIKKMIPARAKARVGVLIEPNIFERPKIIKGRDPDAANFYYSSSIDYPIFITSSYNAGAAVTSYDAYTGRIPVYSYDTGSVVVSASAQYVTYEASGSEIRDRFTMGSMWQRLNNNDGFYASATMSFGDTVSGSREVLQPYISGSRIYGRNQKLQKFFSTAASHSANIYHSSSWKNVDIDNKTDENQAMYNMLYGGVKNTKRTTIDGGFPFEVAITAPTKLVTQDPGDSTLKTGHGKQVSFKDKKKKQQGGGSESPQQRQQQQQQDIHGCTDPSATNYNSNATVDDGSCVYQQQDQGGGSESPS